MAQLGDLLAQLDVRQNVRGRQFERLCGWYLRNAPEYRDRIRHVWLWSEWPGAWGIDAGIDLVAEDRDGGLWAIQAKAYDESYAIKKADVDSFLSESSRPQFSFRLLIATTDHLGPTARRTIEAQREPVAYLLRSQLELAEVAWPSSPDDLRPRRPPRKKPFPHVREAIKATVKGFADEDRGQLIMACGTGKTLAAMWIAERLGSERTLVLVPSLSLLAQTLREWGVNASGPFEYLAVCSDPTVVGEDQLVEHTTELGFPATTDPAAIAAFLRRRGRRVVFATYQSSPQIAVAFEGRTPQFDLAVADEAHRCAGRTSSEFATILDEAEIKARRRLFMTATPRFYTPRVRSEAGQLGVDVASMDNEKVFGPVLHRLTFGEAIERDLLSDYQVVVVGVDDEMYQAWAERGEFVTRNGKKVTDARTLAGQIGLAKSMRKYELRRIISFHGRVKAAREFSADMPGVIRWLPAPHRPTGPIWSEHVSGAMTSGQRDRRLLRFRKLAPDERGLLSNARCLGEGVDVPSIDGIAFIDPRRSTIDIVQALGRAIRKSADKRVGTIVLPVFLSANGDPDQVLNESAFEHVWDVLKALRAHDETLGEELDELRQRLGARRGAPRRPRKIKLDVPRTVSVEFARAFDARLVEQTTASWQFYLGLLQRFVEREGHALVPVATRENGYRLGHWVSTQRNLRARGELNADRERQLEKVSGWNWAPAEEAWEQAWEQGFAHLQAFADREGHSTVPGGYVDDDGFRLWQWVGVQRSKRTAGRLPDERARRLESVPGWTWDVRQANWERGFARLRTYVQREGHIPPQSYCDRDGFKLGGWIAMQRDYRRRGILVPERVRRLESLHGWTWDPSEGIWEKGFAQLRKFVTREGHALVPQDASEDGFKLGVWVTGQRAGRVRLDPDQQRKLEALPGWTWDTRETRWEQGFARLQTYVQREGHSRVPQAYHDHDGFKLGVWIANQRQFRRRGKLGPERVRRLESVPGWAWDARGAAWEEGFASLQRFVEREGHTRVPLDASDNGYPLGGWVRDQRTRRARLDPDQQRKLEALPGWTWNVARQAWWEEGFTHLQDYVQREGHSRVPASYRDHDGFKLGAWVSKQRQRRREGTLAEQRGRRLEALPGWVWSARRAGAARGARTV